MNRLFRLFAIPLLAGDLLAAASGAGFDNLLNNSPFQPPPNNNAPAAAAPETLELRGIVMENGRASLNIYDTTTKKAEWVSVDEPGHAFVVRSFDSNSDTATIEVNRRTLSLSLKRATVQLATAAPIAPVPVPVGGAPAVPGQPPGVAAPVNTVINPSTGASPDQSRLQAIADEIRRRRALRAQSSNQGTPATPDLSANNQTANRRLGNSSQFQQRN